MSAIVQIGINSLIDASIYSLIALGFNLAYGTTKFFNLAHGAMITIGGYGVLYFVKQLSLNPWLGIAGSVLAAGAVGWFLYKVIFQPLRLRRGSNMVLLVASLGAFIAIQSLAAIAFSNQFQVLPSPPYGQKIFSVLGGAITTTQIAAIAAAVFLTAALVLILNKTLFGKAVKAISDDAEAAKIVGVNTEKIIEIVFFGSAALAGLAGVFVGFDIGVEPYMGMPLLLLGVVSAIVGGVGNIWGGVFGAVLIGFAENVGVWFIAGEWKAAIAYAVLILFLIFRPQGIMKK